MDPNQLIPERNRFKSKPKKKLTSPKNYYILDSQ